MLEREGALLVGDLVKADRSREAGLGLGEGHDGAVYQSCKSQCEGDGLLRVLTTAALRESLGGPRDTVVEGQLWKENMSIWCTTRKR